MSSEVRSEARSNLSTERDIGDASDEVLWSESGDVSVASNPRRQFLYLRAGIGGGRVRVTGVKCQLSSARLGNELSTIFDKYERRHVYN